ncbi:acetyl ornithine aminotransferase family protein [Candidatus Bathyarchaeota archaeon]|nr:acetyl ornithine aminotransferase family protein [Candidatus Bathyarchaeota archaeon]
MSYPKIKVTPPGPKAKKIVERDEAIISPSFGRAYPLVVESAQGNIVKDVDGNEFIDMNAGLAVCSVGHGHPKLKEAIKKQVDKFIHYSYTDFFYEDYVDLGEDLSKILPMKGQKKVFYGNSGAESIEAAMKVSRYHSGRQGYLAYIGSFHGRTMGAVTLTASKPYQRAKFSPLIPGAEHIFYPYCYRCPFNLECPSCGYACVDYIDDHLFHKYLPPDEVAMLIAEPIQGEGGYVVPPEGYFTKLKKLLDEHGILFAVDEVQSGVGRTGKWWAIEHWDVEPDILCTAKGIAAGLPLGVMASKAEIQDWKPGSHASTFGGNPVSCAAASAVLDIIKTENLLDNATEQGNHIKKRLNEMKEEHPMIGDVRGKGLMVGVEIVKDKDTKEVAPKETSEIMMECFRNGLAIVNCGVNVIRWMPPLTITRDLIEPSLEIFEKALTKIETQ